MLQNISLCIDCNAKSFTATVLSLLSHCLLLSGRADMHKSSSNFYGIWIRLSKGNLVAGCILSMNRVHSFAASIISALYGGHHSQNGGKDTKAHTRLALIPSKDTARWRPYTTPLLFEHSWFRVSIVPVRQDCPNPIARLSCDCSISMGCFPKSLSQAKSAFLWCQSIWSWSGTMPMGFSHLMRQPWPL